MVNKDDGIFEVSIFFFLIFLDFRRRSDIQVHILCYVKTHSLTFKLFYVKFNCYLKIGWLKFSEANIIIISQ